MNVPDVADHNSSLRNQVPLINIVPSYSVRYAYYVSWWERLETKRFSYRGQTQAASVGLRTAHTPSKVTNFYQLASAVCCHLLQHQPLLGPFSVLQDTGPWLRTDKRRYMKNLESLSPRINVMIAYTVCITSVIIILASEIFYPLCQPQLSSEILDVVIQTRYHLVSLPP